MQIPYFKWNEWTVYISVIDAIRIMDMGTIYENLSLAPGYHRSNIASHNQTLFI